MRSRLIKQGRKDNAAWDERSPHFAEAMHVGQYAYLAKVTNCRLYIVHTTTQETIDEIRPRPVEICSENPVKAFGLYPKKGTGGWGMEREGTEVQCGREAQGKIS